MDCSLLGSSVSNILQERILEWGCHFLLQGIFLTQRLNLYLLYCRQINYNVLNSFLLWDLNIPCLQLPQ